MCLKYFSSVTCLSMLILIELISFIDNVEGTQFQQTSIGSTPIRDRIVDAEDVVTGVKFNGLLTDADSSIEGTASNNRAEANGDDAISGVAVNPVALLSDVQSLSVDSEANRNKATTSKGHKAIAGTLFSIGENNIPQVNIDAVSTNNEASTDSSRAIAGIQNMFTHSNGSDVTITNEAINNEADSLGLDPQDTIAGTSNVFKTFSDGSITITEDSRKNDAESSKQDGLNGPTIAGSVFGAAELSDTNVNLTRTAFDNKVDGNAGTLVSGIQTNVNTLENSNFTSGDVTQGNIAEGGKATKSIAGTQFNAGQIVNSTVNLDMENTDNYATNGDDETLATVAGIQLNVKQINNTDIIVSSENLNNYAMSYGGPTVAGAENNVRQITESDVMFTSSSSNNYAVVRGNGTAVAGVLNQVGRVSGSDVTFNNNATNNVAKVYGSGDAVAGINTFVARSTSSNIAVNNYVDGNEAYSINGDALLESRFVVGRSTNTSSAANSN